MLISRMTIKKYLPYIPKPILHFVRGQGLGGNKRRAILQDVEERKINNLQNDTIGIPGSCPGITQPEKAARQDGRSMRHPYRGMNGHDPYEDKHIVSLL
jgi:hypothetical protein